MHASLSSKAPSPFSQTMYQGKQKIIQIVISTTYSIANHMKNTCVSCTSATILQAKWKNKKNRNPRSATRFPACELQWCICNTASWLQAALQGHKQMAWYYSPDLGLPSGKRVVNHCHKNSETGNVNVWFHFSIKMRMVYLCCYPLYKYFLLQEVFHLMFWLHNSHSPDKLVADTSQKYKPHFRGRD